MSKPTGLKETKRSKKNQNDQSCGHWKFSVKKLTETAVWEAAVQISVTETSSMAMKSCGNDSNCVIVCGTSPGHYPMGLRKRLDLRWVEKMAGGKGEADDQAVYCNAVWTGFARKHLIKASIRMWQPGKYGMFCVWVVVGATGMDMAMLSSAPCILWLYIAVSVYAQDHFHPVAGRTPPPTRRRRLAWGKCEKVSWHDEERKAWRMNDRANRISVQRCAMNAKLDSVGQCGQKGHLLVSTLAARME